MPVAVFPIAAKVDAVQDPLPGSLASLAEVVQDPPPVGPPPSLPNPGLPEPPTGLTETRPIEPSPVAASAPAPQTEADPETLAGQYVEKTRQDAKNAVGELTKEAETLNARLKKVDAALVRWRGLLSALEAPGGPPQAPLEAPEPGLRDHVLKSDSPDTGRSKLPLSPSRVDQAPPSLPGPGGEPKP
jgi:hypothetical protein